MSYDKRLISFSFLSIVLNVIMGIYKIGLAIVSNSVLIFIYAFYNIGAIISKTIFIRNYKKENEKFYLMGVIVVVTSICYMLYSVKMLIGELSFNYHEYIAIGIAAVTFWDIGMATYGIVKAKKRKDIQVESIKLTKLASSFISLNLTQIALLSAINEFDAHIYNGIMGIGVGIISMCIGIYMIYYIRKNTLHLE